MSSTNGLPAPRLIVTSHTKDGKSIFSRDEEITPFKPFGPQGSGFSRFHSRLSVPASNINDPPDLANTLPRCPPNGVLFCTTDIPPNGKAPMHRTLSLDYITVMSGEIVLRLDSGEEKVVKAGEYIVQKGVNHEWINRSDSVCRLLAVMVGSQKIVLENGTHLEETVIPQKK
jgi:quercetin dioxygenase-like cupin family protein